MIGCYDYSLNHLPFPEKIKLPFIKGMLVLNMLRISKMHFYLPYALKKISDLGFDSVQIFCQSASEMPFSASYLQDICNELNLKIASIGNYINISKEYDNEKFIQNFEKTIRYVSELDTNIVCVHVGKGNMAIDSATMLLGKMAEISKKHGIKLALENSPMGIAQNANDLLLLTKLVKNMYINLDPVNMVLANENPVKAVKLLGKKIIHSHVKDAIINGDSWNFVPLGDGGVDLKNYFRELRRMGFRGPVIVEYEGGGNRENALKQSLDYMRNVIKW